MDYQRAYYILFNVITDTLKELDKINEVRLDITKARMLLQNAQRLTEEMYIEGEQ